MDTIGKDHLKALDVLFYSHVATAFVTVVLKDNSDAEQRYAIERIIEAQQMYDDEATIDFVFADSVPAHTEAELVPQFSYA